MMQPREKTMTLFGTVVAAIIIVAGLVVVGYFILMGIALLNFGFGSNK